MWSNSVSNKSPCKRGLTPIQKHGTLRAYVGHKFDLPCPHTPHPQTYTHTNYSDSWSIM